MADTVYTSAQYRRHYPQWIFFTETTQMIAKSCARLDAYFEHVDNKGTYDQVYDAAAAIVDDLQDLEKRFKDAETARSIARVELEKQKNALNDADRLHILIEAEIAGGTRNPDAIDRLKQDLDLLRRIAKRLLPELNKSKHLWLPETQAQCNQLCDLAEKADVSWKEDGFQSDQLDYLLGVRLPAQQAASDASALSRSISPTKDDIRGYKRRISIEQQAREDAQVKLAELKLEYNKKVTSLQADITKLKRENERLTQQLGTATQNQNDRVTQFETDVEIREQRIEDLEALVADERQQREKLEGVAEEVDAAVEVFDKWDDTSKATLNRQINDLQATNATLASNMTMLAATKTASELAIANVITQVVGHLAIDVERFPLRLADLEPLSSIAPAFRQRTLFSIGSGLKAEIPGWTFIEQFQRPLLGFVDRFIVPKQQLQLGYPHTQFAVILAYCLRWDNRFDNDTDALLSHLVWISEDLMTVFTNGEAVAIPNDIVLAGLQHHLTVIIFKATGLNKCVALFLYGTLTLVQPLRTDSVLGLLDGPEHGQTRFEAAGVLRLTKIFRECDIMHEDTDYEPPHDERFTAVELSDCFKSMPDFLLGCCSDINRVSSEKEDSVIYIEGNETCLIVIREGAVEHLFVDDIEFAWGQTGVQGEGGSIRAAHVDYLDNYLELHHADAVADAVIASIEDAERSGNAAVHTVDARMSGT